MVFKIVQLFNYRYIGAFKITERVLNRVMRFGGLMIVDLLFASVIMIFTVIAFLRNSVMYLSISFTLVYFLELYLYNISPLSLWAFLTNYGATYPPNIGIFTAIYIHSINPAHIFFNILILFLAGLPFEKKVGSAIFTLIFIVSGVIANLIYSFFLNLSGVQSYLIGASGAIFGIMGAFIIMYPEEEITMFLGPVLMPRIKVKYAILSFIIFEFALTLLWVNDNIAHGAHVIGIVTGAALGYYLRGKKIVLKREYRLNTELFEKLATQKNLRDIYAKIREEKDLLIQKAWIERFFIEKYGEAKIEGKFVKVKGKKFRVYR